MRLRDPRTLLLLALSALPVVVAATRWHTGRALVLVLLVAIAGLAVRLVATLRSVRRTESLLRLHTITFSHYVEKVRWSLDRLGVAYEEVPNVGIAGVLLTGRTVPWLEVSPGEVRIGESSRILRYLWGESGRAFRPSAPGSSSRHRLPSSSRRNSTVGSATTSACGCTATCCATAR